MEVIKAKLEVKIIAAFIFSLVIIGNINSAHAATTLCKYYLPSTDWNLGTTSSTIKPSGGTTSSSKYLVNSSAITGETELIDVDELVIYVRPNSLIKFSKYTSWGLGGWSISKYNSGTYDQGDWTWIWDGTYNYMMVDNLTEPTIIEYNISNYEGDTVSITVVVTPVGTPQLLSEALAESDLSDRFEVKTLPVTLYNYDGLKFNSKYDSVGTPYMAFKSVALGVSATSGLSNVYWTNSYQVNGGGAAAQMGIFQATLDSSGLPVVSAGQNVDLFSETEFSGKEVYTDVGFEFVYDNETGYYIYNSNLNHAQYDEDYNEVNLYRQTLGPAEINMASTLNSNAGFYPFNDIHRAFLSSDTYEIELDDWAEMLYDDFALQRSTYSAAPVSTATTSPANTVDMHFGLQLATEFYLPVNGKSPYDADGDGEQDDLIYSFTGDDDLWVFIDGELVLDIGGGHSAISGEINFTTGEVTVSKYAILTFSGTTNTTELQSESYSETFTFERAKMHTMQVFYLERFSGVSNCRMVFNTPILPKYSLNIDKTISGDDIPQLGNPNFTFQIIDENGDPKLANTEYKLYDSYNTQLGTGYTDDNALLTIKSGQRAVFEDIGEDQGYFRVLELLDTDYFVQYCEVTIDGTVYTTDLVHKDIVIGTEQFKGYESPLKNMSAGILYFVFNNVIDENEYGSLAISKTIEDTEEIESGYNPEFTMIVYLDDTLLPVGATYTIGDTDYEVTEAGEVYIHSGETAIINEIIAGSQYYVYEDVESSYGYSVYYTTDTSGVIANKTQSSVEVVNTPGIILPNTGGYELIYYISGTVLLCIAFVILNKKRAY